MTEAEGPRLPALLSGAQTRPVASILWSKHQPPAVEKSWRQRLLEPVLRAASVVTNAESDATGSFSTCSTAVPSQKASLAKRWLAPLAVGGPPRQPVRPDQIFDDAEPALAVVPVSQEVMSQTRRDERCLAIAERKPQLTRMAAARRMLALNLGCGLKALTSGEEAEGRKPKRLSPRPPSPVTVAEALYTRDLLGKNAALFRGNLDAEVLGRNAEFAELANHRVDRQRAMQQYCREQAVQWREDKCREEMLLELRWRLSKPNLVRKLRLDAVGDEVRKAIPTPEPERLQSVELLSSPDPGELDASEETIKDAFKRKEDAPKKKEDVPKEVEAFGRKSWTVRPKRSLEERNKMLVNLRAITVATEKAKRGDAGAEKSIQPKEPRQRRDGAIASRTQTRQTLTPHLLHDNATAEMQNFRRVFNKYDKDGSGGLDQDELKGVLQDLGLKAKNEAEREAVRRVLSRCCELEVSFEDLVERLVPQVREALAAIKRMHLREVFELADEDLSGSLSINELVMALRRMNIFPSQEQVQESIQDVVPNAAGQLYSMSGELNLDANVVTWEYFEALASRLEEMVERARVLRKEEICRTLGLTADQQETWKHSLTDVHDAFHLYCEKSSETMSPSHLIHLVRDLNMVPWKRGEALEGTLRHITADFLSEDGCNGLEFVEVLSILERLRQMGEDYLRVVFRRYDVSGSGGLSLEDNRLALKDCNVEAKTVEESREMLDWLEEFDESGSGELVQKEFIELANFITDRLPKFRREKERQLCFRYGWSELTFDELRAVFIKYDADMSENLDAEELVQAISDVRPSWTFDEFMPAITRLNITIMDFTAFMNLIKYHDNIETQRQLCAQALMDKTFTQVLCNVWRSLDASLEENLVERTRLEEHLTLAFVSEKNSTLRERYSKRLQKLAFMEDSKFIKFEDFLEIMRRPDLES